MARVKLTYESLHKLGVELLDSTTPRLRCRWCRTTWRPGKRGADSLRRAWWKCPKGCVTSLRHAEERHDEWVVQHAELEFGPDDFAAIQALNWYDQLIEEHYGEVGELIPHMAISLRIHFEIPSGEVQAVSEVVRAAVMAARERGAPFAEEFWYGVWRSLRQQYGIQEYLEMQADSDAHNSRQD